MRTSLSTGPGGTVTKWLLLLLLTASWKATSFSSFSVSHPKLTTSTATLFFLSFFAILTSVSCNKTLHKLRLHSRVLRRWIKH
jgi:hypothetical protein